MTRTKRGGRAGTATPACCGGRDSRKRAFPIRRCMRVTEIFHSIQGESSHAGRPCVFVRLTGCNLRCRWCDSEYTFTGGERMPIDEILGRVRGYGCNLVEVTGGEPLAQAESFELIKRLCDDGYEVLIETSGSIDVSAVDPRAKIILDLKCPGSGEAEKNRWENLDILRPRAEWMLADRVPARLQTQLHKHIWGADARGV